MTDAALIRSAADGDADALERLIRDLAPSVYAYLAGMLGDDRDASDGMQDHAARRGHLTHAAMNDCGATK
jgi:DNA-directed RNA polymerase specialized sigma24 family protein